MLIEISYRLTSKAKAMRIARAFSKYNNVVLHEFDDNDRQFLKENYYFPERIEWLISDGYRHISSEDTKKLSEVVSHLSKDREFRKIERELLYSKI